MNLRERMARIAAGWQLGDVVEGALSKAGITRARVEAWLGEPCNCKQRKEKLNSLSLWAARVAAGDDPRAKEYLDSIMEEGKGR